MLRKFLLYSMTLTLIWTTIACGGAPTTNNPGSSSSRSQPTTQARSQNRLSDGQYPVQQVTYNDGEGEYTVMVLNTKPGESSVYRVQNLPLARLTDEQVSSGQKNYLKVEGGEPSLFLTPDAKIEYVHNVTENRTNPQTGQQETVVVRQESNFWTPFLGVLAGQAVGSLLFRPQYYVPPVYQRGVPLTGYGGYGSSYNQAVSRYQTRYSAPPAEVRNRQVFRSTGQLRSPSSSQPRVQTPQRTTNGQRSTGSGYGSSTLRRDGQSNSGQVKRSPSGFGSSRPRTAPARRR
jgi:hypothetical protein